MNAELQRLLDHRTRVEGTSPSPELEGFVRQLGWMAQQLSVNEEAGWQRVAAATPHEVIPFEEGIELPATSWQGNYHPTNFEVRRAKSVLQQRARARALVAELAAEVFDAVPTMALFGGDPQQAVERSMLTAQRPFAEVSYERSRAIGALPPEAAGEAFAAAVAFALPTNMAPPSQAHSDILALGEQSVLRNQVAWLEGRAAEVLVATASREIERVLVDDWNRQHSGPMPGNARMGHRLAADVAHAAARDVADLRPSSGPRAHWGYAAHSLGRWAGVPIPGSVERQTNDDPFALPEGVVPGEVQRARQQWWASLAVPEDRTHHWSVRGMVDRAADTLAIGYSRLSEFAEHADADAVQRAKADLDRERAQVAATMAAAAALLTGSVPGAIPGTAFHVGAADEEVAVDSEQLAPIAQSFEDDLEGIVARATTLAAGPRNLVKVDARTRSRAGSNDVPDEVFAEGARRRGWEPAATSMAMLVEVVPSLTSQVARASLDGLREVLGAYERSLVQPLAGLLERAAAPSATLFGPPDRMAAFAVARAIAADARRDHPGLVRSVVEEAVAATLQRSYGPNSDPQRMAEALDALDRTSPTDRAIGAWLLGREGGASALDVDAARKAHHWVEKWQRDPAEVDGAALCAALQVMVGDAVASEIVGEAFAAPGTSLADIAEVLRTTPLPSDRAGIVQRVAATSELKWDLDARYPLGDPGRVLVDAAVNADRRVVEQLAQHLADKVTGDPLAVAKVMARELARTEHQAAVGFRRDDPTESYLGSLMDGVQASPGSELVPGDLSAECEAFAERSHEDFLDGIVNGEIDRVVDPLGDGAAKPRNQAQAAMRQRVDQAIATAPVAVPEHVRTSLRYAAHHLTQQYERLQAASAAAPDDERYRSGLDAVRALAGELEVTFQMVTGVDFDGSAVLCDGSAPIASSIERGDGALDLDGATTVDEVARRVRAWARQHHEGVAADERLQAAIERELRIDRLTQSFGDESRPAVAWEREYEVAKDRFSTPLHAVRQRMRKVRSEVREAIGEQAARDLGALVVTNLDLSVEPLDIGLTIVAAATHGADLERLLEPLRARDGALVLPERPRPSATQHTARRRASASPVDAAATAGELSGPSTGAQAPAPGHPPRARLPRRDGKGFNLS